MNSYKQECQERGEKIEQAVREELSQLKNHNDGAQIVEAVKAGLVAENRNPDFSMVIVYQNGVFLVMVKPDFENEWHCHKQFADDEAVIDFISKKALTWKLLRGEDSVYPVTQTETDDDVEADDGAQEFINQRHSDGANDDGTGRGAWRVVARTEGGVLVNVDESYGEAFEATIAQYKELWRQFGCDDELPDDVRHWFVETSGEIRECWEID